MAKRWLAGCLPAPLLVLGIVLGSKWLLMTAFVLSGIAQLLATRADRDGFFTPARVHRRRGLLGLTVEDFPVHRVDQVLVDPMERFPGMGNLTVQCDGQALHFECVPDAEAKGRQILEYAKAARERRQPANLG